MLPTAPIRPSIPLCLLVALAGCGGGGGGSSDGGAGALADPAVDAVPGQTTTGPTDPQGPAPEVEEVEEVEEADGFEPSMHTILANLPVSASQYVTRQTPIDTANGAVYLANAEPADPGVDGPGVYLDTMVRRGTPKPDGRGWNWSARLVEPRTAFDRWHTLPSVGVDRDGYVHVAYNMHNFPWQYGRFRTPNAIDGGFDFHGEPISDEELALHVEQNRTDFGGPGAADVPGTQVTYPAFARDRDGELYLSSRQAARPAREFSERTFASGIARYDTGSRTWTPVGAPFVLDPGDVETPDGSSPAPTVFAARTGWTSYPPSLEFDADNRMHAVWLWTEGIADDTLERPCAVVRDASGDYRLPDGSPVAPPFTPADCARSGLDAGGQYLTVMDTAIDSRGRLFVALSPQDDERYIAMLDGGRWTRIESPERAGEIFVDAEDSLWAISDGPVAWHRPADGGEFVPVTDAPRATQCYPRVAVAEDRRKAYVHARDCREDTLNVYEIVMLPEAAADGE